MNKTQSLKNLIDSYDPDMFHLIDPQFKDEKIIIPYYEQRTEFWLAAKMVQFTGLNKKTSTKGMIELFRKKGKDEQKFFTYSLSHELKITLLAVSIALKNQDSNVYEMGCSNGMGSLFYSSRMKNEGVQSSKQIYKLTAFDTNKGHLDDAKGLKSMIESGNEIAPVEYLEEEAINYLKKIYKEGDIIFASVAEPHICEGILELASLKKIRFVISYSEATDKKIGGFIQQLIDLNKYNIYPFEDKEFNENVPDYTYKKFGVLALPKLKSPEEAFKEMMK